jgi:hypothetical protein
VNQQDGDVSPNRWPETIDDAMNEEEDRGGHPQDTQSKYVLEQTRSEVEQVRQVQ